MNRNLLFSLVLMICLAVNLHAQKTRDTRIIIAFYNTENSFDTIDDPAKNDEDFLPGSRVAWTSERYYHKLNNIARALTAIDSLNFPAIIGLAEIENIGVLNDLVSKTPLRAGNYQAILEEGGDPRGIDVALIFRKKIMKYAGHNSFPSARTFRTRSVLYVRLVDEKNDTLHVFVNHWKSRSGGAEATEAQRIENALTLKRITDSVLARDPKANLVIMGDFNDEPGNKSLNEFLDAGKPDNKIVPTGLYNLMYDRFLNGEGTLYYKDWDLFDQFVVSGNMLLKRNRKGAFIIPPYAYIFKPQWLLYKNKTGEMVPDRTSGSKEYFGGFSDHLPVFLIVHN